MRGKPQKTLGLTMSCVTTMAMVAGCLPDSLLITPVAHDRELVESTLSSEALFPQGKIAVIEVEGLLLNAEKSRLFSTGENPVSRFLEELDKARKDSGVKAVVLRINSPGGGVTASELMHAELLRFKETGKPTVAMMLDVAASGGYYVACGADEIVACRSTVTGSIGVIMQTVEFTGTMQKIGVRADAIKSGPNKAAGSPFEPMTPPQRALFQTIVDELYDQFVDVVAAGRPNLAREKIVQLADGRVYTADQALKEGLIDRIGTMNDAIAVAKQRAGIKTARVVAYERPFGYVPNYYARAAAPAASDVNLVNFELPGWLERSYPPFLYLWTP